MKDKKPICRAMLPYLAISVPSVWNVSGFKKEFPQDLECFPLYEEAANNQQKKEWATFLSFLQKYNMVATVKTEGCDFYVHPPTQKHELFHAVVYYQMKKSQCSAESQLFESDQIVNESKGPCKHEPMKTVKNVHEGSCELDHSMKINNSDVKNNLVRSAPSFLVTLGHTHSGWIFGAIAELVDNSRDAKATRLNISIDWLYSKKEGSKIPVLSVTDDGCGMCHSDIVRMLSFGHEEPEKEDIHQIGRFGIGFKTGSMRLGKDAIVLTQTSNSRSVALLSQSFNENRKNLETPIVTYCKQGHYMEVDLSIHSEESANFQLKAIKDHSPFNEYFIGEKLGLFGENGSGTQIYIWNLNKWGANYSLEWESGECNNANQSQSQHDILIRSRRIRSRPGQTSLEVPLDYSLRAYLEVIFLEPRMKIYIQGSLVKRRPLVKSLSNTVVVKDVLMDKPIQLTIGRSQVEWERANCGMFLYWHGRLIEAYKRVGGMIHSVDMGRGIIGVIDVTNIMSDTDGRVWVLSNKQGFQDCEAYDKLEKWLGLRSDEYWDTNYDSLELKEGNISYLPDNEWVQCNQCNKWRILGNSYDISCLPEKWFCYMPPFNGKCEIPEQQVGQGVITVAAKRSGYNSQQKFQQKVKTEDSQKISGYDLQLNPGFIDKFATPNLSESSHLRQVVPHIVKINSATNKHQNTRKYRHDTPVKSRNEARRNLSYASEADSDVDSTQTDSSSIGHQPALKRLQRGPQRSRREF